MPKLQAVQIDEDTIIYVEVEEDVEVPEVVDEAEEQGRGGGKGWGDSAAVQVARNFEQIQSTIRIYTKHTLSAFKDVALADVQKVTLEFGINTSGECGMPYVAKGTVGCNLKITAECVFPPRPPAVPRVAPAQAQQIQAQPAPPRSPNGLSTPLANL